MVSASRVCLAVGGLLAYVEAANVGGWSDAEVGPEGKDRLVRAVAAVDGDNVNGESACFNEIKSVETQVVAGQNYRYHVTGCKDAPLGECQVVAPNCEASTDLVFVVFEQTWTSTLRLTSIYEESESLDTIRNTVEEQEEISEEEKKRIEAWIDAEGRNYYGDSAGLMYPGGTPLFDETTGDSVDRYVYIKRKHPDAPWKEEAKKSELKAAVADQKDTEESNAGMAWPLAGLVGIAAIFAAGYGYNRWNSSEATYMSLNNED